MIAYLYASLVCFAHVVYLLSRRLNLAVEWIITLMLLLFAVVIMVEAIERLVNPIEIAYKEAILVAIIGLVVNILSAIILHHDHEHSDHNIKAAYLHVIADALTSLSAILGLTAATVWNIPFIDTIAALVSSFVIIKWSVGLLKQSGSVLLDISTDQKHVQ